jgi:hypothetical protein
MAWKKVQDDGNAELKQRLNNLDITVSHQGVLPCPIGLHGDTQSEQHCPKES